MKLVVLALLALGVLVLSEDLKVEANDTAKPAAGEFLEESSTVQSTVAENEGDEVFEDEEVEEWKGAREGLKNYLYGSGLHGKRPAWKFSYSANRNFKYGKHEIYVARESNRVFLSLVFAGRQVGARYNRYRGISSGRMFHEYLHGKNVGGVSGSNVRVWQSWYVDKAVLVGKAFSGSYTARTFRHGSASIYAAKVGNKMRMVKVRRQGDLVRRFVGAKTGKFRGWSNIPNQYARATATHWEFSAKFIRYNWKDARLDLNYKYRVTRTRTPYMRGTGISGRIRATKFQYGSRIVFAAKRGNWLNMVVVYRGKQVSSVRASFKGGLTKANVQSMLRKGNPEGVTFRVTIVKTTKSFYAKR